MDHNFFPRHHQTLLVFGLISRRILDQFETEKEIRLATNRRRRTTPKAAQKIASGSNLGGRSRDRGSGRIIASLCWNKIL
jgi:hypothetical protein